MPRTWLNVSLPQKPIWTIDLAGKGRFVLLTGIGGRGLKESAHLLSAELYVPIAAYAIGFRQDCEDVYSGLDFLGVCGRYVS